MSGKQFSSTNRPPGYYTYAYLRENGTPWYVGKGTRRRAWDMHGNAERGTEWRPPSNDRILILKWDLTDATARAHEKYMIGVLGNAFADGGLLRRNFTEGGEGIAGFKFDPNTVVERNQKSKLTQAAAKAAAHGLDVETWAALTQAKRKALNWFLRAHPEVSARDYLAGNYEKFQSSKAGNEHQKRAGASAAATKRKNKAAKLGLCLAIYETMTDLERRAMEAWLKGNTSSTALDYLQWKANGAVPRANSWNTRKSIAAAARFGISLEAWLGLSADNREILAKRFRRGWSQDRLLDGLPA